MMQQLSGKSKCTRTRTPPSKFCWYLALVSNSLWVASNFCQHHTAWGFSWEEIPQPNSEASSLCSKKHLETTQVSEPSVQKPWLESKACAGRMLGIWNLHRRTTLEVSTVAHRKWCHNSLASQNGQGHDPWHELLRQNFADTLPWFQTVCGWLATSADITLHEVSLGKKAQECVLSRPASPIHILKKAPGNNPSVRTLCPETMVGIKSEPQEWDSWVIKVLSYVTSSTQLGSKEVVTLLL